MTRNLTEAAHNLFGEIFDSVTKGTDDVWWDLTAMIVASQHGPVATFVFTTYTKSLILGSGVSTIAAFDQLPSPLMALDAGYVRELIVNSVRFVREQRSAQLDSVKPPTPTQGKLIV